MLRDKNGDEGSEKSKVSNGYVCFMLTQDPDTPPPKRVRREGLLSLAGSVHDMPTRLVLDSGAEVSLMGSSARRELTKRGYLPKLTPATTRVSGAQTSRELKILGEAVVPISLLGRNGTALALVKVLVTDEYQGDFILSWPLLTSWYITIEGTPLGTFIKFKRPSWEGLVFEDGGVADPSRILILSPKVLEDKKDHFPLGTSLIDLSVIAEIRKLKAFSSIPARNVFVIDRDPMRRLKVIGDFPALVILRAKLTSPLLQALDQATSLPVLCSGAGGALCVAMKVGTASQATSFKKVAQIDVESLRKRLTTFLKSEEAERMADQIANYWRDAYSPNDVIWKGIEEGIPDDIEDEIVYVPEKRVLKPLPDAKEIRAKTVCKDVGMVDRVVGMLGKYREILGDANTAEVKDYFHRIILDDKVEIKERRNYGDEVLTFLEQEVDRLAAEGYIEETRAEHAAYVSPPLVVKKKDDKGKYNAKRFCIDYKKLNKVTRKDRYNLPNIDSCLALRSGRYFSKIDLKSAYWQIPIAPSDRSKTGFSVRNRVFHWRKMPFGLCNAPATMQRLIDSCLAEARGNYAVGYLDDIVIWSQSRDEHLKHVEDILRRIHKFGLRINLQKCEFFATRTVFLGHEIAYNELRIDPSKIAGMAEMPYPTNVKELRKALGTFGWCRKFILNFASLTAPLTELLRAGVPWSEWGPKHKQAFDELKTRITSAPALAQPDPSKPYELHTDASDFGIGAVLAQRDSRKNLKPCAFISRKLTPAERNYSTREKEGLAIVWAVEKLSGLLWGRRFTIWTDHHSLIWLRGAALNHGRLTRWIQKLSSYDFDIKHVKGEHNQGADGLSRLPIEEKKTRVVTILASRTGKLGIRPDAQVRSAPRPSRPPEADALERFDIPLIPPIGARAPKSEIPVITGVSVDEKGLLRIGHSGPLLEKRAEPSIRVLTVPEAEKPGEGKKATVGGHVTKDLNRASMTDISFQIPDAEIWRRALLNNPEIRKLMAYLTKQELPTDMSERQRLKNISGKYLVEDGLLYFRQSTNSEERYLLEVPPEFRTELIRLYHEHPMMGHRGWEATKDALLRNFRWGGLSEDVRKFVDQCLICFVAKTPSPRMQGLLIPFATNVAKFEVVHIDYVGPVDEVTERGNRYIFTMKDRGSGLIDAVPTAHASAIVAARALWDRWFMRFGIPRVIISDRGAALSGDVFKSLARLAKFDLSRTTAYHPRTNGSIEREHRSLKIYMRAYCMSDPKSWDILLPSFVFVANNSVKDRWSYPPFFLAYGIFPRLPTLSLDSDLSVQPVNSQVSEMIDALQTAFKIVRDRRAAREEKNKKYYDKNRLQASYEPGQIVWKYVEKPQMHGKFHLQWRGPYVVVKPMGTENLYKIADASGKESVVNVEKLARFVAFEQDDKGEPTDEELTPSLDDLFFVQKGLAMKDLPSQDEKKESNKHSDHKSSEGLPHPVDVLPGAKSASVAGEPKSLPKAVSQDADEDLADRSEKVLVPKIQTPTLESLKGKFVFISAPGKPGHELLYKVLVGKGALAHRYFPVYMIESGTKRAFAPMYYDHKQGKYETIAESTKVPAGREPELITLRTADVLYVFNKLSSRRIPADEWEKFFEIYGRFPSVLREA